MKRKSLLLTAVATIGLTAATMAQTVPNYVPTNGLVGWWPFNGNANDESGNGNNGTVNGATLTTDRFGNANKAYGFDGVDDNILTQNTVISGSTSRTYSIWFNTLGSLDNQIITDEGGVSCGSGFAILCNGQNKIRFDNSCSFKEFTQNFILSSWHNVVVVYDNNISSGLNGVKCFLDGFQINNFSITGTYLINSGNTIPLTIGKSRLSNDQYFNGKLDDIGIWNRALTECEIQDLYNAQLGSFSNTAVTKNQTNAVIGSNATLTVSSPISSLQWQSNPSNVGWVNLSNNTQYNGVTNDTLVVSNLQLSNHNQPFRVLACGDTSNVATIQIADTCITNVTIYDTLLTSVTDTLIINTTLSLPAPNNENTILIYPNPASDHITIDNGNYIAMAGYTIKIENNAGQQVFQSVINQPQFYIDLSTWSGNGLYFVHLIDPQNNTVTVRKIVLH
jgi:hypothetical protein